MAEGLTALKADCNTACELVRVESREATVWPYFDLQKELLDIRLLNPLRVEAALAEHRHQGQRQPADREDCDPASSFV